MTPEFSYDVFLSYSSKDKQIVLPLAERLRNDGLRVWFDDWSIQAGDNIPHKIEEGLEQSRVLVLCMSENAFGSDWAQLESQTFRFRDPLNKERRFIPLRLDLAPVKGSLVQFAYISWSQAREEGYAKLLEACRAGAKVKRTKGQLVYSKFVERSIKLDAIGYIVCYAFSHDGTRALCCGQTSVAQLWDLMSDSCLLTLEGHNGSVWGMSFSATQRHALSGSADRTVRLWDLETGVCIRVFKDHSDEVNTVTWSPNQDRAASGGDDASVRLWDINTGRCLRVLTGHEDAVWPIVWSSDGHQIISGAEDGAIRLWDVNTGRCLRILSGHTSSVYGLSWSADHSCVLSGSADGTIRLWDLESGRSLRVLEGHESGVRCMEWNTNQRHAVVGDGAGNLRVWDLEAGSCLYVLKNHGRAVQSIRWDADQRRVFSGDAGGKVCIWNLSEVISDPARSKAMADPTADEEIQYTNAKVLLVGESGAGKTGLTERLSQDSFTPSYSTSGTWSTQWQMQDLPRETGWEREVWLWDFGGQSDQRLIHQLYLDKTALVLLVFNSDRDAVLPGLREWQQALQRSVPPNTETFLVAGRTDVGMRFDRDRVTQFAKQNGFRFFETSAQSGVGCNELRKAIQTSIQWKMLERRTSPVTFKLLKDAILELRDKGDSLLTFKELREMLRRHLPATIQFTDSDLDTVVGLLDGPGVVKELNFGTYILLRPEWLNIYAQAVIRTLKAARTSLGCLPVQSISKGELIFQTTQADGKVVEEKRLKPHEEMIVLQAMEQALIERKLCLRQEGQLVFPSYYGLEQPFGPMPPQYFISYTFGGFLDDIYATLIVRLAYCGAFKLRELWRDAADFETLAQEKKMGVKLLRKEDGSGELLVHFEKGVATQEQVIFATYIHDHLKEKASAATRLRFYVCQHCDTPVQNREIAMQRLEEQGEKAKIICVCCEKYVSLWDDLEKRFASESVQKKVAELRAQENQVLDSRRKGKLLALEVMARITSADQKCFEIPAPEDEGLDVEVEFADDEGHGTGKRLYLQLKAGNSHLQTRKRDGAEIFKIKKQSWVKYWLKQDSPVLLVIGTFPKDADERRGNKERFTDIRWMEISDLLRRESENGTKSVRRIVFQGERLNTLSVRSWRAKALRQN